MLEPREFFPCIEPILPTVYSKALSYEDMIGKLVVSINKVIEQINNVTTDAVEQSKLYTDSKFNELIDDVNQAVAEVNAVKNDLSQDYQNFITVVNAQLTVFNNEIRKLDDRLEIGLIGANAYTNFAISQNNDYLLAEVSKGLSNVKVVNYFTGQRVSVQEMFDYLAQFHLDNAISYTQLIAREKTYTQLADLNITYTELALNGYTLIN